MLALLVKVLGCLYAFNLSHIPGVDELFFPFIGYTEECERKQYSGRSLRPSVGREVNDWALESALFVKPDTCPS